MGSFVNTKKSRNRLPSETAVHAFFKCTRFTNEKDELREILGQPLPSDNLIRYILESQEKREAESNPL